MSDRLVIFHIPRYENWIQIFDYYLEECTRFRVFFPGAKHEYNPNNPLMTGKKEFASLSEVTIRPWEGMENSIQVDGPINQNTRNLFYKYLDDPSEGYRPLLWSFELLKNEKPLLRIEDFTVCLLNFDEEVISNLQRKKGITWEEIAREARS